MVAIRNVAKLIQTAEKGLKATRKNAGKLVKTVEKNGQKIETYEKQVGKYNPFRRTKTVTTRFVEGEEAATRVTVQRQKGSLFQTHTSYADGRSATSVVDVKKGEQIYHGPSGALRTQSRAGLDKTHTDEFRRTWRNSGLAAAAGVTAGGIIGFYNLYNEEAAEPIEVDKAATTEQEEVPAETAEEIPEQAAAPTDSVPAAPADSIPTAPAQPVAPNDSVPAAPADSVPTAPAQPVAPNDSVPAAPADSVPAAPAQPVAPTDSVPAAPADSIPAAPAQPVAPTDSVPAAPADSVPAQPAAPAAPAAPAQQTPPSNNLFGGTIHEISIKEYDVQPTDCLWNIARRELEKANPGVTINNGQVLAQVKEFIRLNPQIKNPDLIYPNQKIKTAA